jgi:quinol-cytochrome oxidoreductase complex cytochrome b subunit
MKAGLKMKLCPNCKSDLIERHNYYVIKIIVAIILLFIPFGFFICWLPFVLSGNYHCKNCGEEFPDAKEIDWREFEKMKQEKQQMENTND